MARYTVLRIQPRVASFEEQVVNLFCAHLQCGIFKCEKKKRRLKTLPKITVTSTQHMNFVFTWTYLLQFPPFLLLYNDSIHIPWLIYVFVIELPWMWGIVLTSWGVCKVKVDITPIILLESLLYLKSMILWCHTS